MSVLLLPQSLPLSCFWLTLVISSLSLQDRPGSPVGLETFWMKRVFQALSAALYSPAVWDPTHCTLLPTNTPNSSVFTSPAVQRPWSRAGLERVRIDQGDGSNARRPGLGPAFGWGAFLPAPETRISDNSRPACPGLKTWMLQKDSSSIMINGVGGIQMGSSVE